MNSDFERRSHIPRNHTANKSKSSHGSKSTPVTYPRARGGMSFMKSILENGSDPHTNEEELEDSANIPILHYGDGPDRPKTARGRDDDGVEIVTSNADHSDSSSPIKVEVNVNLNDRPNNGLTFDSWAQELGLPKPKGRKRKVVSKKKMNHVALQEDRLEQKYEELRMLLKAQFLMEKQELDQRLVHQTRAAIKQKQRSIEGYSGRLANQKSRRIPRVASAPRSRRQETENISVQTSSNDDTQSTSYDSGRDETHILIDTIEDTVTYKKVHFSSANEEDSVTSDNQQDSDITKIEKQISMQAQSEPRGRPPRRPATRVRGGKSLKVRPVSAPSRSSGSATFSGRFRSPDSRKIAKNNTKAKYLSDVSDDDASDTEKSKERQSLDHRLKDTQNQKIKGWLKQKNQLIRKQRKTEKQIQKEKQKLAQQAIDERKQRQEKSEEAVAEWMQRKKQQSRLLQRNRLHNDRQMKKSGDSWDDTELQAQVLGQQGNCTCCKVHDHAFHQAADRVGFERKQMNAPPCSRGPHECTCGYLKAQKLRELQNIERLAYKPGSKSPRPRPMSAKFLYDRPSSPQISNAFPQRKSVRRPLSANANSINGSVNLTESQKTQEWERDIMQKRVSYNDWLKKRGNEQAGDRMVQSTSAPTRLSKIGQRSDGHIKGKKGSVDESDQGTSGFRNDAVRPKSSRGKGVRPQSGRSFPPLAPPQSSASPSQAIGSRVVENLSHAPSPPETPVGDKKPQKSILVKSSTRFSSTSEGQAENGYSDLGQAENGYYDIAPGQSAGLMAGGAEFNPEEDYQSIHSQQQEQYDTLPDSPGIHAESELSFGQDVNLSPTPGENEPDFGRPKTSFGIRPDESSPLPYSEEKPRWDDGPEAPTEHDEIYQRYKEQFSSRGESDDNRDQSISLQRDLGEYGDQQRSYRGLNEEGMDEPLSSHFEREQYGRQQFSPHGNGEASEFQQEYRNEQSMHTAIERNSSESRFPDDRLGQLAREMKESVINRSLEEIQRENANIRNEDQSNYGKQDSFQGYQAETSSTEQTGYSGGVNGSARGSPRVNLEYRSDYQQESSRSHHDYGSGEGYQNGYQTSEEHKENTSYQQRSPRVGQNQDHYGQHDDSNVQSQFVASPRSTQEEKKVTFLTNGEADD